MRNLIALLQSGDASQANYFTRDHWIVYFGVGSLFVLGWMYMAYMAWAMQNMDVVEMWMPPRAGARAWTLYDFWMLFAMWGVMMVAMMVPSVTPMVTLYVTVSQSKRSRGQQYAPTFVFLLGYLVVWILFRCLRVFGIS